MELRQPERAILYTYNKQKVLSDETLPQRIISNIPHAHEEEEMSHEIPSAIKKIN
jgi:hypothetical protein